MSESEEPSPRTARMRRRQLLRIRRDDHIGDPVGMVFLDATDGPQDAIPPRLAEYLGSKVTILKAQLGREEIELEVECRAWREEANRLAAAARELLGKGARRNAIALYREALAMDPLNADALRGLGLALVSNAEWAEALRVLKLAREVVGDSPEILAALGRCYTHQGRATAARAVFERLLRIDPQNFIARRELRKLDARKPGSTDPAGGPAAL